MTKTVDSYRFISGITKQMIRSWISMERPREIPWTPLARPLADSTVSLISTAGIALKTDRHLLGLFDLPTWWRLLLVTGFEVIETHLDEADEPPIPMFVCLKRVSREGSARL